MTSEAKLSTDSPGNAAAWILSASDALKAMCDDDLRVSFEFFPPKTPEGTEALYPHFGPFLTKFGDNGGAYDAAGLKAYFAEYFRRGYTEFTPDASDQEMKAALQPYL